MNKRATTMLGGFLTAGLVLALGATAFAQDEAKAATTSSLKVVSAVGTLTATAATNCQNITCPVGDTCDNEVLTGTSKNFNRFGGFKGNSQFVVCVSTDTLRAVPNGNDGTTCAPSSGLGILTSGNNSLTFSMAGQTCTLPGLVTGFTVFNQVAAITASTDKSISTGGGAFNAWENGTSGTFNLSANYSK